jgi:hypothetical protein
MGSLSAMLRRLSFLLAIVVGLNATALEEAGQGPPQWPRLAGHWGLAVSLATFGPPGTQVIARDYVQVGITPGVTLKIDEHWAVDLEFIGFSRWDFAPVSSHTIWVVDPGLVYNFGPAAVGLRTAVQIGEGIPLNYGLVPIVVVPFRFGRLAYFLEADLPIFVSAQPGTVACNVTALFQTGFAF